MSIIEREKQPQRYSIQKGGIVRQPGKRQGSSGGLHTKKGSGDLRLPHVVFSSRIPFPICTKMVEDISLLPSSGEPVRHPSLKYTALEHCARPPESIPAGARDARCDKRLAALLDSYAIS
jgi:hypothetical protein